MDNNHYMYKNEVPQVVTPGSNPEPFTIIFALKISINVNIFCQQKIIICY
jgi:hypothetical protein